METFNLNRIVQTLATLAPLCVVFKAEGPSVVCMSFDTTLFADFVIFAL